MFYSIDIPFQEHLTIFYYRINQTSYYVQFWPDA